MSWITDELGKVNLGDKRLNKRCAVLLERLSDKPTLSIPGACKGWAETQAAYRFFSHEKVTKDTILLPHIESTKERMRQHPVVLCVEDSSFINHDSQRETKGLGPHTSEAEHGYFLHPQLAMTPERLCLGTLRLYSWIRDGEFGKRKTHQKKPIEEKESHRWIEGYRKTCELQKELAETQLVYIADRECDIYELFTEGLKGEASWLIRAVRNRKTREGGKLRENLLQQPALGTLTLSLSNQKKRKRRKATLTLYSTSMKLQGPRRYKQDCLPDVNVSAILAVEKNAPAGEEPLDWLILTDMEISSFESAKEKLSWYACRWQIEIFFNTLKSGCAIEKLQLETRERLEAAVALYMIIAWRLLYIKTLNRIFPDIPCDKVFDEAEWQAIYLITQHKIPPREPPALHSMIKMLALLGGYLNRKNDPPPGPKVLWIGLQRARDFVLALNAQKIIRGTETYV